MAVKVGILGAGFIGRMHALNLRADPRVELVGIADVAQDVARRLGDEVGTRLLPDLAALLDAGVQAVYITTPNIHHATQALAALEHGVHVFCEKPMAVSLESARAVRDAARRSSGICQIGFNRRFANVYRFVRRVMDEGRLRPLVAQMKHNRGELRRPAWTSDPRLTGGYLYETPVHLFDMARYLFGDAREIWGWARQNVYAEPDGFTMLLRFQSGVISTVTSVAHATWLFPSERIEIYGEHAAATTEELERAAFSPGMRAQAEVIDCAALPMEEKWGYLAEDRLFIDAVLGEGGPAVTAEDGYGATELVEACSRAARSGHPVSLPLPEPGAPPSGERPRGA